MNVYDFDNTIYDGETLVDFILYYVRTDPRIWRYVPKLLVIAFKDAFHLFTVAQALEAYACAGWGSSSMWAPLLIKTPARSFACVFWIIR